jgi:hypothetical protein
MLTRITSNVIENGTIIDADISATAAISMSKMGAGSLPAGTTSNATGATTQRALPDRFADIINVKDFGAVGDGVADDAPAIRAAFNLAVTKLSSTVLFPQGIYKLKTFWDGSTTFVTQTYGGKGIIVAQNGSNTYNTGTTVRKLKIIGDGAVITSGLFADNQLSYYWQDPSVVPSNPNNYGPSFISFFGFTGNWNLEIDGLKLESTFGGVGERQLRNYPVNETLYCPYGAIIAFGVSGALQFTDRSQNKSTLKITNCTFNDFFASIDIWLQKDFIYDNNVSNLSFGHATVSSGGVPNVQVNGHDAAENVSITNNIYNGCLAKDLTFLSASQYSPTITLPAPGGGTASVAFTNIRGGQDGFWHSGASYNQTKEVVTGNTIRNYVFEAIKTQSRSNTESLKSKTSSIAGDPGAGYLSWNNATQLSATRIYANYTSSTGPTVSYSGNLEDWFKNTLKKDVRITLYFRPAQKQTWIVSGNPIFNSTYVEIPVTFVEAFDIGTSFPQDTVLNFYNENADFMEVVWSNNNIDGTFPLGSNFRPLYSMACNASNQIISNNYIKNGNFAIQPNQQGSVGVCKNILISNNTCVNTAYPPTGYQPSPRTQHGSSHISITEGFNVKVIGNKLITIDPYDPSDDGNPSNINGNGSVDVSYSGFGNITIENNNCIIENPNAARKYCCFQNGGKSIVFKNNNITGYNVFTAFGGAGNNLNFDSGVSLLDNNIFTGEQIFQSLLSQSYPVSSTKSQFTLFPSAVGWYRAESSNNSWLGKTRVAIKTPSWTPTGTVNTWDGQQTLLELIWVGNPYVDGLNIGTINQIAHTQNVQGTTPISEIAIAPYKPFGGGQAGLYFYVSKLLQSYPVKIYDRSTGGSNAYATANFTNGILTSITGLNGGSGYTSDTKCIISPAINNYITLAETNGSGAILTPVISGGVIQSITITNGGSGYSYPIEFTFFSDTAISFTPSTSFMEYSVNNILKVPNTGNDTNPTESNSCLMKLARGIRSVTKSNAMQAAGVKIGTGTINTASGVPSTVPEFIGQDYLDTATNKFYKAKGTSTSADWIALN